MDSSRLEQREMQATQKPDIRLGRPARQAEAALLVRIVGRLRPRREGGLEVLVEGHHLVFPFVEQSYKHIGRASRQPPRTRAFLHGGGGGGGQSSQANAVGLNALWRVTQARAKLNLPVASSIVHSDRVRMLTAKTACAYDESRH